MMSPSGSPGPTAPPFEDEAESTEAAPRRRPYSRPEIVERRRLFALLGASPGIGDSLDPFTRRSPENSRYFPQPPHG